MNDIDKALLGDVQASKRITERGLLLPCPFCNGRVRREVGFLGLNFFKCRKCGAVISFDNDFFNEHPNEARLAWNTRAAVEEQEFKL